jgi:hypothetical protein
MQQVLIQTSGDSTMEAAGSLLSNRSLLYNRDKDLLYIKYAGKLRQLGYKPDNDNIVLNENNEIALADDVHCQTLTVLPDESGIAYQDNIIFAETTDVKRIVLLFRLNKDETMGNIGGKFYEMGEGATSGINFSASVSGSRHLDGSSTGEPPKWCRCTYRGADYLGIKFNPNTTIYFSGYSYLKNAYKIDFDYTDAEFDAIVELTDDANQNTNTIVINNPNSTTWDFTEYCEGLSGLDNETEPNTEYDLTNGLVISDEYAGTVFFYPDRLVKNDVGYITVSGQGRALCIKTDKVEPKLKIYFSSNADTDEARVLSVWDSNNEVVVSGQSRSNDSISVLKLNMDRHKNYYIGSESSRIRIHKIVLTFSSKEIVQDGWDPFTYTWDWLSVPTAWSGASNYNWGNGLTQLYSGVDNFIINTTDRRQIRENNLWNQGYIATPGIDQYVFQIDIDADKTNLECVFSTDRQGGYRTLSLLDSDGNTLVQVGNRGYNDGGSNDTKLSILRRNNLSKGTYYFYASAPLRIYRLDLTNAGQQLIVTGDDINNVGNLVETLDDVEETGENGDSHYITLQDQILTMADLQNIANKLRNSDVQVHLNLKDCTVAADAENWTNLFQNCTSLTYLGMPQGVKTIGVGTFIGCMFLKKIEICDSVEEFNSSSNEYIFSGARARTFILPKHCSKIGWNTFANSAARNIIIKPDTLVHFYNMIEYGSFFNTLNYIKIYMTQAEYNTHDWSINWEHSNYFGDNCVDNTIAEHIVIYNNYEELLEELGYEEEDI